MNNVGFQPRRRNNVYIESNVIMFVLSRRMWSFAIISLGICNENPSYAYLLYNNMNKFAKDFSIEQFMKNDVCDLQ